ncbi:DUF4275 family protein [Peribacillus frigoritolerans]
MSAWGSYLRKQSENGLANHLTYIEKKSFFMINKEKFGTVII